MNGINVMIGVANTILIILVDCSLTLASSQNGTLESMMADDVQCLAQMPVGDLMKIRKAIGMMHAVSVYDAQRLSNASALQINNQTEPAETRTFQMFGGFTGSTTTSSSPLAQSFVMAKQPQNQLT